jgi:hypothetical protein
MDEDNVGLNTAKSATRVAAWLWGRVDVHDVTLLILRQGDQLHLTWNSWLADELHDVIT